MLWGGVNLTTLAPKLRRKNGNKGGKTIFLQTLKIVLLILGDVAVGWFLSRLIDEGFFPFAIAVFIIALAVNIILLVNKLFPLRWMVVGLVLMGLFTIYPILFTVWISFTNYGEGHLVTKQQAIDQILTRKYLPEAGKAYKYTAYKTSEGEYALWLVDPEGAPDQSMQRVFQMMDKKFELPKKILELNPRHRIIKGLADLAQEDPRFTIIAEQIYEDALLVEGLHPDPVSMVGRIQDLMASVLEKGSESSES